ncbi:hypothetical protein JYA63_02165 [Fictibacillus nanhaiensis]|uniref:Pre-toxin TG domain-containing protein n=1 Tax=Fictibacillus nanhaiensis TaxID=742169 RepID=A0ABS2ZNZ7_9BACL|nr:hypothetical protein [Fictibacillus nanhaiensis]
MKIKLRPFLASCAVMVLLLIQFTPMVAYATITPWEGNPWEGNEWNKNSWDGVTWESEEWEKDGFSSDPNTSTDSSSPKDNDSKEVNETKKIDKDDKGSSDFKIYDGLKFAGTMINESFVFAKDMLRSQDLGELTDVKSIQNMKVFGWDAALLGIKTISQGTFIETPSDFAYDSRDIIKNAEPARKALINSWSVITNSKTIEKLSGKFGGQIARVSPIEEKRTSKIVGRLSLGTAATGTVLSSIDAYKSFKGGKNADGVINTGSAFMNAGIVLASAPHPLVKAASPFVGAVGVGLYATGMLYKKSKTISSGYKKSKKLLNKAGGKLKRGIKSLGAIFG